MENKEGILRKWLLFGLLCTPASWANAQGSVTLYGVLDASVQYASRSTGSTGASAGHSFALTDAGFSPSFVGFMGSEDLGGGVRATFDLESGIDVANGGFDSSNGNYFGRQAWVGVEGDFGRLRFGEQFSPLFLAILDADPRYLSTFASGLVPYGNFVGFTSAINSNAIIYRTPKFANMEGTVMFAPGGVAGNFQAGRQWSAGLKYADGTLTLSATLYDGNAGGTPTPVPTTVAFVGRQLGASYRFGELMGKVSFVKYKVAGSFDANVYNVGISYQCRPDLNLNGGVWVTSDRNRTTNHSILAAVGANYSVSKRTMLYAQVGYVDNHGGMNTGLSLTNTAAFNEPVGGSVGANLGIRQSF
jgi:predicted porin